MSTSEPVRQPDVEPAPQTLDARANLPSPSTGRYAGIGQGRVIAMSDSLDEVMRRLDEAGADRRYVEIWELAPNSDQIQYAWSCRQVPPENAGVIPWSQYLDNPVMRRNEEFAQKITKEARANANSPYANKVVAIVNGQVAALANNWDELYDVLKKLRTAPEETLCLDTSPDSDGANDIW
jgi:hypothetical protein